MAAGRARQEARRRGARGWGVGRAEALAVDPPAHLFAPPRPAAAWRHAAVLQGDPSAVPYAVENARQILGKKPVFGICMGHQVLGQAFGAKTFKLKFGHHGGNHPLRYGPTGKIEISAQNHNFAVDVDTLPDDVEVRGGWAGVCVCV